MNNEVYFWHIEKHLNFLDVDFIILGVSSQACPKYLKYEVCIFCNISIKNMGDDVVCIFLLPDKYEGFLQGGSIILDVCNQACPKYPK